MINEELIDIFNVYLKELPDDKNYILHEELRSILNSNSEDVFILDIRQKDDYEKNHLNNSINIPFRSIMQRESLERLPKNKLIVIICNVGHSASQALVMLRLLGYNAKALKFGIGINSEGKD